MLAEVPEEVTVLTVLLEQVVQRQELLVQQIEVQADQVLLLQEVMVLQVDQCSFQQIKLDYIPIY